MDKAELVLGIDVGSVSVGLVVVNPAGEAIAQAYRFHHGEVRATLGAMLAAHVDLSRIRLVAATDSTPAFVRADRRYHNQLAIIAAARAAYPALRGLLHVGGEKFSLAVFDESGHYQGALTNTSCAAGTGSFLDQQAGRLGIGDTARLSEIAHGCTTACPKIASRCAVFAKTDLIHAQQEGYGLDEISNGLCRGLARNIVDTLFAVTIAPGDIVFCGGVGLNRAVAHHITELIGRPLRVAENGHLYGALGACRCLLADDDLEPAERPGAPRTVSDLFQEFDARRTYDHAPLELQLSEYPEFSSRDRYEFTDGIDLPVEVDIYGDLDCPSVWQVTLGIDIGSTSTKAVLLDPDREVVAGFYTKTAGRPLAAVQAICRAVAAIESGHGRRFTISGCGTTGSGRKFVGAIIGADTIIDEITAHARAACQLDPAVDTIIEIGGQDAKFTTLSEGRVTSSVMNNVCAAGTGSFIEEQAAKLDCPIGDYSRRTEGIAAPMVSDRCTVFMERDINHLLSEGYSVDEVLAAALHSVRENYLLKVATENNIGATIFFQGATAKNRSLVAAFEQRLQKPILVSKFCHLTGALGTALILAEEERAAGSRFVGIDLYDKTIPIRTETCDLCTNHCKLAVAEVDGTTVAYGFLCGRDYGTRSFVRKEHGAFDLLTERRTCFPTPAASRPREEITIGLPAAVHLHDELNLWRHFFAQLSVPTITSTSCRDALNTGKNLSRAEFCAPMTAMHGHVAWLQERADYVFLPVYLEQKNREARRQYCYYTQYLSPLTSMAGTIDGGRILQPVIRYLYTPFHTKMQLYRMLRPIMKREVGFLEVSQAYDLAISADKASRKRLQEQFHARRSALSSEDFGVVLLGRPYTVLSPQLNCGIPGIFNNLGIDTYYQDMLPAAAEELERIRPLLDELHWTFAAKILETAEVVARRPGLYPVYITSFKCSPDSFGLDYFKRIMAFYNKPYLILELDEHDSSVGYETRIEAAVRSFRNHHRSAPVSVGGPAPAAFIPRTEKSIDGRTVVFPNWDRLTCSFLVAVLRGEGIDAVLMDESDHSIREALKHNTGQCIPLNAIAQGYMNTIRTRGLDPASTLLWLNRSSLACNIRLYPHHIRTILADHGMGQAGVYRGDLSFADIGLLAMKNAYFAYMFGGMLRKVACRIRPYELYRGETDRVLDKAVKMLCEAFQGKRDKGRLLEEVMSRFEWIETRPESHPKVAIFGDLYSRDNRVLNQDLVRFIEAQGGEVITTPYSEYAKMIALPYFRKWFNEGNYRSVISNSAALVTMKQLEKSYQTLFNRVLDEPEASFDDPPAEILARFNVAIEHTGESMDNLLKVYYIKKHYPDVALFVQASPALCCASLITEAMREKIEEVTGVPVVSITYDGTGGRKNDVIIPYLRYPRRQQAGSPVRERAGLG